MRKIFTTGLILTIALTGLTIVSASAFADRKEHDFDNFDARQYEYNQRDREKQEQGYVLKRLYKKPGQRNGTISLGGGEKKPPQFGLKTHHNYNGTNFRENEPPSSGFFNMRLKF